MMRAAVNELLNLPGIALALLGREQAIRVQSPTRGSQTVCGVVAPDIGYG